LRRAYEDPRSGTSLRAAFLESPEALLGTFLLDRAGVERWAEGAPVVTDEHPWMEFFRRHGRNMIDREIATLTAIPQSGWDWVGGLDGEPDLRLRIEAENRALRLYVRS